MASIYGITGLYQQMNNYRLMSGMTSRLQGAGSLSRAAGVGAIKPITSVDQFSQGSLPMESALFARDYQKQMTELADAANGLRNAGTGPQEYTVSADNNQVAEVAVSYRPAEAASYQLEVKQMAAAQVNRSDGMDLAGTEFSGDLTLITNSGNFTFQTDPSAANNLDAMKGLAQQVNDANAGITASVTQKDGKAVLELTSAKTGESGAFLASGSLADAAGLRTAAQQAQNAVFSVSKNGGMAVEHTSERNEAYVDGNLRIKAQFKQEGSVTIQAKADTKISADSMEKMVDSFNSTLKLLNDNAMRGKGVLTQMKRMLIATGDEKSMNMVGISTKKDGTLSFDRTKYLQATSEDPSLAQRVVGGSFGLADNIYTMAQQGLRQSSNSLLSQDLKLAKLQQAGSTANLMASYSRNGAYALSNYQMSGALLNMLV